MNPWDDQELFARTQPRQRPGVFENWKGVIPITLLAGACLIAALVIRKLF